MCYCFFIDKLSVWKEGKFLRVVKEAEERRTEILDVSERLFESKGYDKTSTNDILREIGIARGTLYYYFSSKEEILDAVIDRMLEKSLTAFQGIAMKKDIPVMERITMAMLSLNIKTDIAKEVLNQAHKPQNALMHQKIRSKMLDTTIPVMTEVFKEAIDKGICNSDYPRQTIDMVLSYSYDAFDDLAELNEEARKDKAIGFIYNLELLFGMERNSLMPVVIPLFQ